MTSQLPTRVCSLDIETERTSFKTPEKSKLLFVGILTYTLRHSRYFPGKYQYFLPHQMKELEAFLRNFSGIIIGHNLLHFDYRVLHPFFSLNEISKKTVDTLLFLHRKSSGRFSGLSLRDLADTNLKRLRKIYLNGSISKTWHSQYRQKAVEYNKMDCRLTMAIWSKMVRERQIHVPYVQVPVGLVFGGPLTITTKDLRYLLGNSPRFSFKSWKSGIDDNEPMHMKAPAAWLVYYWHYCPQCRKTYLLEVWACSEAVVKKPINCPSCGIQFGKISSEENPVLVGSVEQNLADGRGRYFVRERTHDSLPEQFKDLVLQHLRATARRKDSVTFIRDWKPPRKYYALSTQDGNRPCFGICWAYCDHCDKTIVFEDKPRSQRSERVEMLRCPRCRTPFKTADRTSRYIFVGELNGIIEGCRAGSSSNVVQEEFLDLVLKYMRSRKMVTNLLAEDLNSPF